MIVAAGEQSRPGLRAIPLAREAHFQMSVASQPVSQSLSKLDIDMLHNYHRGGKIRGQSGQNLDQGGGSAGRRPQGHQMSLTGIRRLCSLGERNCWFARAITD